MGTLEDYRFVRCNSGQQDRRQAEKKVIALGGFNGHRPAVTMDQHCAIALGTRSDADSKFFRLQTT